MSTRSRRAAIVAFATLLAVSGLSATATATAAPSPAASATGAVNKSDSKSIQAHWTAERMRAATPEPVVAVPDAKAAPEQVKNVLPSRSAEGSLPTRKISRSASPSSGLLAGQRAERWGRQGSMPALTIGKIYYTRNDNSSGYCTGSVINAANKNTVWTSGHCVHAGSGGASGWFRDFIFVPDADNGLEPQGRWTWRYANTTNGWFNNHNWSYDIAAIAFNPQPARGNLQDWTGSQGYKFNQGQAWTGINAFGFPQDGYQRTDFTGNDLWYCFGNVTRASSSDDRMHMNNDMFHGSSGGPWLQDLQLSRGWGYIIGANSHRDVDANQNPTNIVYKSPYHGDGAVNVYNDVTAH